MSWRYSLFMRLHFLLQDVIFGAGFGMLWSSTLGWVIHEYLVPMPNIITIAPWIGGLAGFAFGSIASAKFGKTRGSTQEHEKALVVYGEASTLIIIVVSVLMGMTSGYIYKGIIGLLLGGVVGGLIVYPIGNVLAHLYFAVAGKVIDYLLNINSLLRGSPIEKIYTLVGLLLDYVFKAIEILLIKLKFSTREKLTGVTDAWEYYDKGIKLDKKDRTDEAIDYSGP